MDFLAINQNALLSSKFSLFVKSGCLWLQLGLFLVAEVPSSGALLVANFPCLSSTSQNCYKSLRLRRSLSSRSSLFVNLGGNRLPLGCALLSSKFSPHCGGGHCWSIYLEVVRPPVRKYHNNQNAAILLCDIFKNIAILEYNKYNSTIPK